MLFHELIEIIDPEPHGAALNMAVDEALFLTASGPALRIYQWIRPSLSFGYFGTYESVHTESDGRDIVRRWTGGGIVQHGEDITYSLIVPARFGATLLSAKNSYRTIHNEIAAHLSRQGLRIGVAGETRAKMSDACFENPVQFDLVLDGLKIGGAAQRRSKGGLLHQGSIRIPGVNGDTCEGLGASLATHIVRRELCAAEIERARVLEAEKYATETWLKKF